MKNLLHVGCGYKTKKDTLKYYDDQWIETRVDINPDVNPDILGTMKDLSKVKSDFDSETLPLMIGLIDTILEEKPLKIDWKNFK